MIFGRSVILITDDIVKKTAKDTIIHITAIRVKRIARRFVLPYLSFIATPQKKMQGKYGLLHNLTPDTWLPTF